MIAMIVKKTRIVRPTTPDFERSSRRNEWLALVESRPSTPFDPATTAVA